MTIQFVTTNCPSLKESTLNLPIIDCSWDNYVMTDENRGVITDRPHLSNCFHAGPVTDASDLKTIVRSLYEGAHDVLLQTFVKEGLLSKAAWLRSAKFQGSGKFLAGWRQGAFYGEFVTKGEVFREAFRIRSLQAPLTAARHAPLWARHQCGCGKDLCLGDNPFHLLDCPHGQWYRIERHDAVKRLLAQEIKRTHKGLLVQVEESFALDSNRIKTADITVRSEGGDKVYMIDVSVVEPAAPSHVKAGSAEHANTANRSMEKTKIEQYNSLCSQRQGDTEQFCFVPFVLEATGRLGIYAEGFLKEMFPAEQRNRIKAQIGAKVMQFNAVLMRQMYKNMEKATSNLQGNEAVVEEVVRPVLTPSLLHTHQTRLASQGFSVIAPL